MSLLFSCIVLLVIGFYAFREAFFILRKLWHRFVHFLLDDPTT